MNGPNTITAGQLRTFIEDQGILPFHGYMVDDNVYALLEERWITAQLAPALETFYRQFGIDQWKENANACGRFAKIANAFAAILHARALDAPRVGLAFGEFWYVSDRSSSAIRHGVNFAVVPQPASARSVAGAAPWKLLFFEPQTRQIVKLSTREIFSCFALKI